MERERNVHHCLQVLPGGRGALGDTWVLMKLNDHTHTEHHIPEL